MQNTDIKNMSDDEYEQWREQSIRKFFSRMGLKRFAERSTVKRSGRAFVVKTKHDVGFGGEIVRKIAGVSDRAAAIIAAHKFR